MISVETAILSLLAYVVEVERGLWSGSGKDTNSIREGSPSWQNSLSDVPPLVLSFPSKDKKYIFWVDRIIWTKVPVISKKSKNECG